AWTTPERLEILLLQAVDGRRPDGQQVAEAFTGLGCVSVHPFEVGGLGREAASGVAQARKLIDVARLGGTWRGPRRLVEQFEPDLVYSSQQRWDQRLAVPLAESSGRPRVVHLHYNVGPWLGARSVRALTTADMVVTVSEFIRGDAIAAGAPADRVQTLL